jgi:dTDP-4-amino-4,6-dideoxygalactose transaminase
MGLTNLPHLEQIIKNRTQISKRYDLLLSNSNLSHPVAIDNTVYNYSYYPVIFPNEEIMLLVKNKLELNNILTRRYFYPSLNNLPYLESYSKCSTSENIASRILCLPLYDSLTFDEVENICKIILSVIN